MNYLNLKKRHADMINELPIYFAFSDKQFDEVLEKLNIKHNYKDVLVSVGMGGFMLKTDLDIYNETIKTIENETETAIYTENNHEYLKSMWIYELNNHEYLYTRDVTDTVEALGFNLEELKESEKFKHIYKALLEAVKELKESDRE